MRHLSEAIVQKKTGMYSDNHELTTQTEIGDAIAMFKRSGFVEVSKDMMLRQMRTQSNKRNTPMFKADKAKTNLYCCIAFPNDTMYVVYWSYTGSKTVVIGVKKFIGDKIIHFEENRINEWLAEISTQLK